jgi:hypothetical protein
MEPEGSLHLSTLHNDYIIYCTYNILLSAYLAYGLVLMEISLHPLSVDATQALLCCNLWDSM